MEKVQVATLVVSTAALFASLSTSIILWKGLQEAKAEVDTTKERTNNALRNLGEAIQKMEI
jgi:hypothetical protein